MANPYSSLPTPVPSTAMLAAPVAIIDSQYCIPHQVDLTIVKKVITARDSSFTVTDVNDNVVFMVKSKVVSLRDRLVLNDAAGNTMVTLRRKVSPLISLVFFHDLFLHGNIRQKNYEKKKIELFHGFNLYTLLMEKRFI